MAPNKQNKPEIIGICIHCGFDNFCTETLEPGKFYAPMYARCNRCERCNPMKYDLNTDTIYVGKNV